MRVNADFARDSLTLGGHEQVLGTSISLATSLHRD